MSAALASIIATAMEAARAVDEQRLAHLEARVAALEQVARPRPESGWMTPPAAAKASGISTKRLRSMMESGQVVFRAKNQAAASPKYEVSISSLDAALAGEPAKAAETPRDAAAWAVSRTARKAAQ